ncbi:MAG TPA: double-strand break repair protein AddB, partial [Dongiaceae bacterium]|nr:double-strand break repair protein AddB [Dongiaceae bacterium]
GGDEGLGEGGEFDLPLAIAPLRRQLLLTQAILRARRNLGEYPPTIDQASRLAAELARLLDQMATEQVGFEGLSDLALDHAEHWQKTVQFLEILSEVWPAVLATEGALDPAERRNRLLAAEAARLLAHPPREPIIAAGSTGSIPATAELLSVIAGLPHGRVILPGLDRESNDEDWKAIESDPLHPQHGMALLLKRFGLAPAEVALWPAEALRRPRPMALSVPASRTRLINEALRPAETTGLWHDFAKTADRERIALALKNVERVDCATLQDEAQVIALRMRQALEEPGKRAALITPDRDLARRVASELGRWDIEIDDSAGRPLSLTPPAVFLRLVADTIAERAAPATLLSLLKHPIAAGGVKPVACRQFARELDIALRGPRPRPGLKTLARLARLKDVDLKRFVARLAAEADTFADLIRRRSVRPADLLSAHVALAESLAASDSEAGPERLWAGEAGEAAANFVTELADGLADFPPIAGARWPTLFESLMAGRVVRPRFGRHPRLSIWGPLEARLQQADLVILGGLNEKTWPPEAAVDPWFSRPMRQALGLTSPERRIGMAAHDFAQAAASAPELMLTRSLRVEGSPTVPSRWLLRFDSLLRLLKIPPETLHAGIWLGWQRRLDDVATVMPIKAPAPRPPVAVRPTSLSVTEIETWLRDPYAIYARRILKLEPLDPLDGDPTAAERGSFIHEALEAFVKATSEGLPADAHEQLMEFGRKAFGQALERPTVFAFWWPRFRRIARWFVEHEARYRLDLIASIAETRAVIEISLPGCPPFTLRGKADRIDRLKAGGLAIIDYKTGGAPSDRQIQTGYAPQLPLEALMAAAGKFAGVPAERVEALAYWQLKGGRIVAEQTTVKGDPMGLAAFYRNRLETLIATFNDPDMPYHPLPDPKFVPLFRLYDHLSRRAEWGVVASDEMDDVL